MWPVAGARCLKVSEMAPGHSHRSRVMDTGKETFPNRNTREGDSCQMEYSSTPLCISSPLLVRGPAPVGMCRSAFCCSQGPWSTLGTVVLCCCEYSCVHLGACQEQSHPYRVGALLLSCRRWSCPSVPARSEWQGLPPVQGSGLCVLCKVTARLPWLLSLSCPPANPLLSRGEREATALKMLSALC